MPPEPKRFPCPRWPFYLADALVVAATAFSFLRGRIDVWAIATLVVGLSAGAAFALVPLLWEAVAFRLAPEAEPGMAATEAASVAPASTEDEVLAEIAALTSRIQKRAAQDPENNRVILRNAGKVLEELSALGVEVVSYAGRKIDLGSNVEILDAVDGEYNRVLEESDPQVQRHGRLLRRAIVTVGNGNPPDARLPASDHPPAESST